VKRGARRGGAVKRGARRGVDVKRGARRGVAVKSGAGRPAGGRSAAWRDETKMAMHMGSSGWSTSERKTLDRTAGSGSTMPTGVGTATHNGNEGVLWLLCHQHSFTHRHQSHGPSRSSSQHLTGGLCLGLSLLLRLSMPKC
jgi:hypothetical protein